MPSFILMLKSTAPVRLVIEKLIYILENRDKYYSDYKKKLMCWMKVVPCSKHTSVKNHLVNLVLNTSKRVSTRRGLKLEMDCAIDHGFVIATDFGVSSC